MKKLSVLVLFLSVALLSCKKDTPAFFGESVLSFRLTDAPGPYDKVNIDVKGLEVKVNDTTLVLDVNKGVYNLLDFVNGKDTILVDDNVPSGKLSQVRLILGDNNTVQIGDKTYELKTPSAQQSGLKLNVHADLYDGVAYEYLIDFDAEKSIVHTGNGNYILKPVLRVSTTAVSGGIKGVVSPASAKPVIYAISADKDSLTTHSDAVTGRYMFRGLAAGTYKLSFEPEGTFRDSILSNIEVRTGVVTVVDTVKFK